MTAHTLFRMIYQGFAAASSSTGDSDPPVFVSSSIASTAVLSSRSVGKPLGVVEDDVMFALVTIPSSSGDPNSPVDWTQVGADQSNAESIFALFFKVAGSSEGSSYTFSDLNEIGGIAIVIGAWRNVNPISPIGDEAGATHSMVDEFTCGPVTPEVEGSLLIMFLSNVTSQTFTSPVGMTERHFGTTPINLQYIWDESLLTLDPVSRTSEGGASATGASFLVALNPIAA